MERREILKIGLFGGALLLADRVVEAGASVPRATHLKLSFYTGTLNGGPATNWALQINIAAARIRGNAFEPVTTAVPLPGFSIAGTKSGAKVTASLFDLSDTLQSTPLGTLTGRINGTVLSGKFELNDGQSGTFKTHVVKSDARAMQAAAGNFDGQIVDADNNLRYKATASVSASGAWELSNVEDGKGNSVPGTIPGYFVLGKAPNSKTAPSPRGSFTDIVVAFCICLSSFFNSPGCCMDDPDTPTEPDLTQAKEMQAFMSMMFEVTKKNVTGGAQGNLPNGQPVFVGYARK